MAINHRIVIVLAAASIATAWVSASCRRANEITVVSEAPSPLPTSDLTGEGIAELQTESTSYAQADGSVIFHEAHSQAVADLVSLAKQQHQLEVVEVKTLLAFVLGSKPDNFSDGEWNEKVNVILNILRSQANEVPGLADVLLNISQQGGTRILRLYGLQHLAQWYRREPSKEKRQEIIALLVRLSEADGEEAAGCAVMFLNDIQHEAEANGEKAVDEAVILRAAVKLTSDTNAKQDVRISALHTCAERGIREVLPQIRQIAADSDAALPLRKAAIYTIGEIGDQADRELLNSLGFIMPDLKVATMPAIVRLQKSSASAR